MAKKYNNFKNIFLAMTTAGLCFVIFFLNVKYAFALEVQLPGLASNPTLPTYVAYFFGLGVYLTIFVAGISFAVGAVGLIMSGGNSGLASESKGRMKSSIFGLALAAIAFLILKTASPATTTPTINPLPTISPTNNGPGVYFTDNTNYVPAPQSVSGSDIPTKLNNIKYICGTTGCTSGQCMGPDNQCSTGACNLGTANGPDIIVWQYQNTDFTKLQQSTILSCGSSVSVNAGSLQWDYEKNGIYLCSQGCNSDGTCQGLMSPLINSDQTPMSPGFNTNNWGTNVQGIRFVNDSANNTYYGAILSSSDTTAYENSGSCSFPIISKFNASDCETQDIKENSINSSYYLNLAVFSVLNNSVSKIGVNFYSNPNGWTTNNQEKLTAGIYNVKTSNCPSGQCVGSDNQCSAGACGSNNSGGNQYVEMDPSQMCYDYSNSIVPTSGQYKCGVAHNNFCGVGNETNCSSNATETVQDGIGSLQISGGSENYLVAIYSGQSILYNNSSSGTALQSNNYCQIFRNSVPNFNALSFPQYYEPVTDVYVIKTK